MLKHLKIKNVGPSPEMELDFGERLNLLTGDNGLGKSFLLDIAWWALTRQWPAEVNTKLPTGLMARPYGSGEATIEFTMDSKTTTVNKISTFHRRQQAWTGDLWAHDPSLVMYAQVDGSFAVWDLFRNYPNTFKGSPLVAKQKPPFAYVFSPEEVWNGLEGEGSKQYCNGLIRDWASWQKEKGEVFDHLRSVLEGLSPSDEEKIEPGELARIDVNDARDIPTLRMPYGKSVPIVYASAGMRRIIALAYILVWSWEEHKKAGILLDQEPTSQSVFLIDEVEAHLHPKWQRKIIRALIDVMKSFAPNMKVQVVTTTHSPLIMASVEPFFDPEKDAWFDLDLVTEGNKTRVELTKRDFEKHGDVTNWLTSEAFDLLSARSEVAEKLIDEADDLLEKPNVTNSEIETMRQKLVNSLSPQDGYLFRWRAIAEKKGFLK